MKDSTEILCIIDRSGSMITMVNDAIGGFNAFLEEQKKLPGEANISIVLFDNEYILLNDRVPIKEVKNFDHSTYVPRGSTALLDAIGKSVNDLGNKLKSLSEAERPNKVVVTILTDGEENSSHEFNRKQIFNMIKHQEEKYSWNFVYLGVGKEGINDAASIGINVNNTMCFTSHNLMSVSGTSGYYGSLGQAVTNVRSVGNIGNWKEAADQAGNTIL